MNQESANFAEKDFSLAQIRNEKDFKRLGFPCFRKCTADPITHEQAGENQSHRLNANHQRLIESSYLLRIQFLTGFVIELNPNREK